MVLEYFKAETEKKVKPDDPGNGASTLKHLTGYLERIRETGITFREIDKRFCEGFKDYLRSEAAAKTGKERSTSSQAAYFDKIKACLDPAVKDGVISPNPAKF